MSNIVYGVHGFGRGHATRASIIIPHLVEAGHKLLVLAGDSSYEMLKSIPNIELLKVPTLRFHYNKSNEISYSQSLVLNIENLSSVIFKSSTYNSIKNTITSFNPSVCVSDSEVYSSLISNDLNIRKICFDHVSYYAASGSLPLVELLAYIGLSRGCEERIGIGFFPGPEKKYNTTCYGPLIRPKIKALSNISGLGSILAYFNVHRSKLHEKVLPVLTSLNREIILYADVDSSAVIDKVRIKPINQTAFALDLATCKYYLSTAGFQSIAEASFLKKKIYVVPEKSSEQELNARHIKKNNIGYATSWNNFSRESIEKFLKQDMKMTYVEDSTVGVVNHLKRFIER